MIIDCPHCGARDSSEFFIRGEVTGDRPGAGVPEFADYVYRRENPAGLTAEHWHHGAGCRSWLVVTRDTRTHAIASVALAQERRR